MTCSWHISKSFFIQDQMEINDRGDLMPYWQAPTQIGNVWLAERADLAAPCQLHTNPNMECAP